MGLFSSSRHRAARGLGEAGSADAGDCTWLQGSVQMLCTVSRSVQRCKAGGKAVCVGSAAEPRFGQHRDVAGALVTADCEGGWANKALGGFLAPSFSHTAPGRCLLLLSPATAPQVGRLVMTES